MKPVTILIADDDAEDRFIIGDSFADIDKDDLKIAFCEDGVQVLEYLTNNATTPPQLIIMDLNMPRMTGKEALEAIRCQPQYDGIPVIIFSTSGTPDIIQECKDLGAMDYLIKPTDYKKSIELANYFHQLAANAYTG